MDNKFKTVAQISQVFDLMSKPSESNQTPKVKEELAHKRLDQRLRFYLVSDNGIIKPNDWESLSVDEKEKRLNKLDQFNISGSRYTELNTLFRKACRFVNTGKWLQFEGSTGRFYNEHFVESGILKPTKFKTQYIDGYNRHLTMPIFKVDRNRVQELINNDPDFIEFLSLNDTDLYPF